MKKQKTLEDGEKIESKIPEEEDLCKSLEPKSSEVKEEVDDKEESNCFLPSIFCASILETMLDFYVKTNQQRNIKHRPKEQVCKNNIKRYN